MSLNVSVLRQSFDLVVEREPHLTKRFYEIFFERYPEVKPMFRRNAPEQQQKMLTETLVAVLDHLEDAQWLQTNLAALGRKHVDYGVEEHMYPWVGESLISAMSEVAGDEWNDQIADSWAAAYRAITEMALAGAREARPQS
jgi:hemoglobin-like flavoprotein